MIRLSRQNKILALIAILLSIAIPVALIIGDGLNDEIHKADVAIVLGNEVFNDGRPSPRLVSRLDRALELYREGVVPSIIVSGGTGYSGYDEAKVMASYLEGQGVPSSAIILDSAGRNTKATAINSARIMRERGFKSALVVTQYFHISRSRLALQKAGISPVYSAHARIFETRDIYSIPREIVGYISYWLRSFEPFGA